MSADRDPYLQHWTEQFGALLRDRVGQLCEAWLATGLEPLAHEFEDPYDGDTWRIIVDGGEFYVCNIDSDEPVLMWVDIVKLGVRP